MTTDTPAFPLALQRRYRLTEALKSAALSAIVEEIGEIRALSSRIDAYPLRDYTEVAHGMLVGATAGALTAMLRARHADPCLYVEPNGRRGEANHSWAIASGGALMMHGGKVLSAKTEIAVLLRALEVMRG